MTDIQTGQPSEGNCGASPQSAPSSALWMAGSIRADHMPTRVMTALDGSEVTRTTCGCGKHGKGLASGGSLR